jgi:hypothetical protein
VAGHIFQARPVWIYTLRVTSQTSYSSEYTTPMYRKNNSIKNHLV